MKWNLIDWHPAESSLTGKTGIESFPHLHRVIKIISRAVSDNLDLVNYNWKIDPIWAARASDTLAHLQRWYYDLPSWKRVMISEMLDSSIANSKLFSDDDFDIIEANQKMLFKRSAPFETEFQVVASSTLEAIFSCRETLDIDKTLVLNFTSGMKPWWEFRAWLFTQEDELIISSWLYLSLISNELFYLMNRFRSTHFYSDQMIFSPEVPIIRDAYWELLNKPFPVAFISSPAVNRRMVLKKEPELKDEIDSIMIGRIGKILAIASANWYENLILWAWWCGAFWHSAEDVSSYFAWLLLRWGEFEWRFKNIIFSIYSKGDTNVNYDSFCRKFAI
ncbi:MAG: hypothetical protein ACD_3C00182G0003 [uncultured bacterium (gcode 4)]|uniref:Microbial-type PARG catalytic domain-containing protein n=1 Tax=uncultured bacterium (gcode 4) TaxID=1234023 RepID=K2G0J5_9BACT|nr:MAG: hypothetical protein ACD_3C00182G0003 [uncultured bacterium (gcode 4)]